MTIFAGHDTWWAYIVEDQPLAISSQPLARGFLYHFELKANS